MAEKLQATGSNALLIYGKEASWGTSPAAGSGVYKEFGLVSESLDENVALYNSNQIRKNRTRGLSVRGTRRPGGTINMELAAEGPVTFLLYALLGGTPNTTGTGPYTHVFEGTTSSVLPSFSMEKGFTDLAAAKYQAYKGMRVGSASFQFNIDAMATASFEVMGQVAEDFSLTSLSNGHTPTPAPLNRPFTSVQVGLYKDDVEIAVVTSLSLNVDNGLYGDTGFVLGSVYRQNLKAGRRSVGGSATFLFDTTDYYDLAMAGTTMELKILCTDANNYSVEFRMPTSQLLPNNTSPKIESDGPIQISADFESVYDSGLDSDIECTIINGDSDITN